MQYLESYIWLLTWPLLAIASYFFAIYGLKKFEKNRKKEEE